MESGPVSFPFSRASLRIKDRAGTVSCNAENRHVQLYSNVCFGHRLQIPGDPYQLSSDYMNKIEKWTDEKKMKVNESKTKNLIFNFSKNYQLKGEQI